MQTHKNQQGAVLVVALVFLLLTATISGTVMQSSVLETKMAGNAQLNEEAFQQVQAIANAIAADSSNLIVSGDVGYKICPSGTSGCDRNSLALISDVTTVPDGVDLSYHVERLGPLFAPMPFRMDEDIAGSASAYSAALFEIKGKYDGSSAGLGKSQIGQGIAVRVANSSQ